MPQSKQMTQPGFLEAYYSLHRSSLFKKKTKRLTYDCFLGFLPVQELIKQLHKFY